MCPKGVKGTKKEQAEKFATHSIEMSIVDGNLWLEGREALIDYLKHDLQIMLCCY